MVVLQTSFYVITGAWVWVLHTFFDGELSLRVLFSTSALTVSHTYGWTAIMAYLFAAPLCAWLVVPVIGRARQCLDFVGTVYGYHLLFTWFYDGSFPAGMSWWVVHLCGMTGSVVLSEFLCMRKEMEAIPSVHAGPLPTTGSSGSGSVSANTTIPIGASSSPATDSAASNSNASNIITLTNSNPNRQRSGNASPPLDADRESLLSNSANGSRIATISLANGAGGGAVAIGIDPTSNSLADSPTFAHFDQLLAMTGKPERSWA